MSWITDEVPIMYAYKDRQVLSYIDFGVVTADLHISSVLTKPTWMDPILKMMQPP